MIVHSSIIDKSGIMYLKVLYFVIIEICFLVNDGFSLEIEKIIGGYPANLYDFKYQVSIQRDSEHICGGGIISNRCALTAAHCVYDDTNEEIFRGRLTIVVSTLNVYIAPRSKFIYNVEWIYIPAVYVSEKSELKPDSVYSVGNNIALLKLRNGFRLSNNFYLSKLQLPEKDVSYINETLLLAGHGFNNIEMVGIYDILPIREGISDGILRYGKIDVLPYDQCGSMRVFFNEKSAVCGRMQQRLDDFPEGSCVGDGGSPLVYNGTVVYGILVLSTLLCQENVIPSLYVKVSHHLPFINNILMNQNSSDILAYEWSTKTYLGGSYNIIPSREI